MAGSVRTHRRVVAVAAGSIVIALICFQLRNAHDLVPKEVLDMAQVKHVTGSEVRSMVDRLHGKGVAPATNQIAEYAGPRGSATLYVSSYDDPNVPRFHWQQMTDRIMNAPVGQTVFLYKNEQRVGDLRVSVCSGLDQEHYFFAVDDALVWLAVRHPAADSVLADFILKSEC